MIKATLLSILKGLNKKVNKVEWRALRNTTPISEVFGYDRGDQSIYRYYIDKFVNSNSDKIAGDLLEVGEDYYMKNFKSQARSASVIHYREKLTENTFVGDLTDVKTLPAAKFDCFICTQTFQCIYDLRAAISQYPGFTIS